MHQLCFDNYKNGFYWQELIKKVRATTAACSMNDKEIREICESVYERWQNYPDGTEHHRNGDTPMDGWFISRICEDIHENKIGVTGA